MKRKLIIIFISVILFNSCKKDRLTDNIYSDLLAFNEIELNSTFDIYLKEDSSFSINIVGDKSIIENVTYKIENKVLKINNDSRFKWLTPKKNKIEIYINSKPLKRVSANQTCFIRTLSPITSDEFGIVLSNKANQASLELNCKIFYYWNNFPCGGKLTLNGKTEFLKIWNYAIMSVDARNLNANNAIVENNSKGNCDVTVLNRIEYSITGEGDINLYGSPSEIVEKQMSSSGQFIKH